MTRRPARRALPLHTARLFRATGCLAIGCLAIASLATACGHEAGTVPASAPPGASDAQSPATGEVTQTPACPLDADAVGAALDLTMSPATDAACGLKATDAPRGSSVEVVYFRVEPMMYEYSDGEPVTGVGDGARWEHVGADVLVVKSGGWYFSIQSLVLGNPPGLDPKDVAVTVAHLVLDAA